MPQRGAAQHGAQEQPIGFQDAGDLDQRTRQVVDPVQAHGAHHQVETPGSEGQGLLVGDQRRPVRTTRKAEAKIGADQAVDRRACAEGRGDFVAVTAKIERQRKATPHVVQPLDQAAGDLALEERSRLPFARGTLAPHAQGVAVEHEQGIGGRHRPRM